MDGQGGEEHVASEPKRPRVGLFELRELLGEGATSRVHRARHLTLGTEHAVKVLRSDRVMARERFLEEGRALAVLRHPNIVAVHAIIEERDEVAIAMELVEGRCLEDWRRLESPTADQRLRVFRELVAAVREIHRHGFVHRDLKPENVLVARVGDFVVPKLVDLGIARGPGSSAARRTLSGVAMGTPRYMAPEQIRDAASADLRADVFALGVVLYELLTDHLPFTALDLETLYEAIRMRVYTPFDEAFAGAPSELGVLVDRMLSFDPAERPASCDEVLAALPGSSSAGATLVPRERVATVGVRRPPPVVPAPTRWLVLGLVTVGLGVLGFGGSWGPSEPSGAPLASLVDLGECAVELQAPLPAPAAPARGTLVLAEDPSPRQTPEVDDDDRRVRLRLFRKKER